MRVNRNGTSLYSPDLDDLSIRNIYIPVVCTLRDLISARGRCSNGRGRDNAWAEGECIIRSSAL